MQSCSTYSKFGLKSREEIVSCEFASSSSSKLKRVRIEKRFGRRKKSERRKTLHALKILTFKRLTLIVTGISPKTLDIPLIIFPNLFG